MSSDALNTVMQAAQSLGYYDGRDDKVRTLWELLGCLTGLRMEDRRNRMVQVAVWTAYVEGKREGWSAL